MMTTLSALISILGIRIRSRAYRVTAERFENNWSLCVVSAGAADANTAVRAALHVQNVLLRLHFEQSASSSGILRLLASSSSVRAVTAMSRAVTAMLRAPAHPWTLDALAATFSKVGFWHETVMAVPSPRVRYEGANAT
jgi:hypothetical protein